MNDKISKWNDRYRAREGLHGMQPAPLVVEAASLAGEPGIALDIACGAGRNALYLAENGWMVIAVDGSSVAIQLLNKEAKKRGLTDRIETHVADLESRPRDFAQDDY